MIELRSKVSVSDNNVRYNTKMEGYATFMSGIPELYEIALAKMKILFYTINCRNMW